MEIYFATSNKYKFAEAAKILKAAGITLKHLPFEYREIRSDSIEEIARNAAAAAYKRIRMNVFVEDAGLFIDALNGFPGTYSAWVETKLGNKGILKLMEGVEDKSAHYEACIAYQTSTGEVSTFRGECHGRIAAEERGKGGFGYDPIFIPDGSEQTFAENIELKNKLSHRYKSLLEFSKSLHPNR